MTGYEQAKRHIDFILSPIQTASMRAIEQVSEVLRNAESDIQNERISAIPPMIVGRVKIAQRAIKTCLDEIVEQAQDQMAAELASFDSVHDRN